jgi:hypothetical protein
VLGGDALDKSRLPEHFFGAEMSKRPLEYKPMPLTGLANDGRLGARGKS